MNRFRLIFQILCRFVSRIKNKLCGYPFLTPSFGSMTLDEDDLDVAGRWITNREGWYDDTVTRQYAIKFAEWNSSKYAYAFMGGRVALSAAIYALDLRPGDEIIVPGYTCIVVDNALLYDNLKPIYSDIELDTYGLDSSVIEDKITGKTRAILLQHLYGLVCRDYIEIMNLAQRHNLKVIEDCAHSTGAEYYGKKVGNLGDVAFYSNEQSKVFNTIQGGLVVTNNDAYGKRLKEFFDRAPYPDKEIIVKQLRSVGLNYYKYKHPQRWWIGELMELIYGDDHFETTSKEEAEGVKPAHYGCKMPSPVAALGICQLAKIDTYNEKRRTVAKQWEKWCRDNGYQNPLVVEGSVPVYLRYPVLVEPEKKRNHTWALKELGVDVGVWFTSNLHPSTKAVVGCPNADIAISRCINFPCL
jgi:perosamine synthetase